MIKEKNKKNKSLIELTISESKALTDEEKTALRNWIDGIVEYVDRTIENKYEDISKKVLC